MKRAPRSLQHHVLYRKYNGQDSEISALLGKCGLKGLLGRWLVYAANGHGGNVLLRQRGHRDYAVSILEVASPDMSRDDILAREAHWKDKLGARAHGLNEN